MLPAAAIHYFIPPQRYPWRWAGDGAAVEWEDNSTVCLWIELHSLLRYLSSQGLPPLGSIVLVLMACGKRQTTALASVQAFAARATGAPDVSKGTRSLLRLVANVLEAIAALPEDLRTGLSARAHLLATLFERIDNHTTPQVALELLRDAEGWRDGPFQFTSAGPDGVPRLLDDLKALISIHQRHDLTKLESLLRTGIEFVTIHPAEIPQTPDSQEESTLPLLNQLENQDDPELVNIAAVARRVVAMFALPRPVGFPQELPIGGISDITNRGPLDRLLPSELAADDTILMARLANDEALYFRRDTPPGSPASTRIILMDSGIRLWGLPRLYALAAALGLKSNAGTQAVSVLRREGHIFKPLCLETIRDIQSCLEHLSPNPDATAALKAFTPEENPHTRPDVFFLTTPDPRATLQKVLHGLAGRIGEAGGRFHVVSINRNGALELSVRTVAGSRVAASGRIDPDKILRGPGTEKSTPSPEDRLIDLPAIIQGLDFYQQYPLPFRFPATPLRVSNDFRFAHWCLNVDTKRRLMMWDDHPGHGAGEITTGLPRARDYHINRHGEEWIVLCSGKEPGHKTSAIAIGMKVPSRREVVLDSSHPFPLWMKCQNGAALLGYPDHAEACSLTDGVCLHRITLPKNASREAVIFDGQHLGMAMGPPETPEAVRLARSIPVYPSILATPVSAGFVASGTLIIRAQGGRWELVMPEFIFTPTQKSQLSAVRPFRRVIPQSESGSDGTPAFYEAHWHEECRLIFDTRGLLSLLLTDRSGHVELTLLCLLGQPVPGWVARRVEPEVGNADWFLTPSSQEILPSQTLVPFLQRFAALARAVPG